MDEETRDAINEVKKDSREAVNEVKKDTKDQLTRLEGIMSTHFDQQRERAGVMFHKIDELKDGNFETRSMLARHAEEDARDFGQVRELLTKVATNQGNIMNSVNGLQTARAADIKEKQDDQKDRRKRMWGIIIGVITAVLSAAALAFFGLS